MSDLNPSKSWAATPHHVEGVPPIVYFCFIIILLFLVLYIYYRIKKEKAKKTPSLKQQTIMNALKATKKPAHS
jgi:uncharacterized membrane protein